MNAFKSIKDTTCESPTFSYKYPFPGLHLNHQTECEENVSITSLYIFHKNYRFYGCLTMVVVLLYVALTISLVWCCKACMVCSSPISKLLLDGVSLLPFRYRVWEQERVFFWEMLWCRLLVRNFEIYSLYVMRMNQRSLSTNDQLHTLCSNLCNIINKQ